MFNLLEIFLIIAALILLCVPVIKWALTTIAAEMPYIHIFKDPRSQQ